jgi:hypothetical protein
MARVSTLTVLPGPVLPIGSQPGMTLDRYAEVIGLDVNEFNGVNIPTVQRDEKCHAIIKQSGRDLLARYLLQAEQRREEWLNYFLAPKWTIGERQTVGANNPFILHNKHLIEVGYPTVTVIEDGVAIDHGPVDPTLLDPPNDPITITVTTDVDTSEIVVYYPDELVQITPNQMVDNGDGTVTISIPRARLVLPELNDDRDDPLGYYVNSNFLDAVDVARVWADESIGAEFVWRRPPCVTNCATACQAACPIIEHEYGYELSIVHFYPATYSSGWTTGCWNYSVKPDTLKVAYRSGLQDMNNEIYTIRLAHTLMPRAPCRCDVVRQIWEDDREHVEHMYTRYGDRRGAVDTWLNDADKRITGGIFAGIH